MSWHSSVPPVRTSQLLSWLWDLGYIAVIVMLGIETICQLTPSHKEESIGNTPLAFLKFFFYFNIVFTIFIGTIVGGTRNKEEFNSFPRSHISIGNDQFMTELSKMRLAILKNVSIRSPPPKEKMQSSFFDSCYYVWANNKRASRNYALGRKQVDSGPLLPLLLLQLFW